MTVLSCLFLWLISQGIQPVVPALTPADLHVQLSLRGGKTTFRQGEAIRLILSFTADRAGYILDETTTIPASPIDDVIVSPNTGVFHWLDRYSEGFRYSPDYSALFPVSATPATVELALNQWVRFDAAGEYTLRIVTRRVSPIGIAGFRAGSPFQAVTNAVTFRIEPMSDTEEAAEVGRLSTLLASTSRILSLQQERCEDLAFLPGDDAAREKVRQYLHPEGHLEGNWTRDLSFGFYISRHPTVIVSMFDDLLRDVTHPARSDWVVQATAMRNWIDALADPASAAPPPLVGGIVFPANPEKIFQSYLSQLTDSLASRTGISRRQTAVTVLTLHVGHGPVPAEARRVVVEEFDQLDVSDQRWLVQSRWRDLRDPSLLPALRQLVAGRDPTGRGPLIEALRDLSPADGRAAIVAEITNPKATTDLSLLQSLPDKVLPEVDTTLLTQVQTLAAAPPLREAYLLSAKTAAPGSLRVPGHS